jgi:glucuronokinase
MNQANAFAFSRAGLLGNPSDGYGGKALAVSLANFRVCTTLEAARELRFVPGPSDLQHFPSLAEALREISSGGCDDGLRLLRAAVSRFAGFAPEACDHVPGDARMRFEMRYETDVPRQVGLAGSSAIVVSALRALARWFDVPVPPFELAELALAAEVEDLGIAAGPMDRVIQAYEGLVVMDLAEPRSAASYRSLDVELLPPMFLAWDPRTGSFSGRPHADLRSRWLAGDADVLGAIQQFRDLVDEGVASLERGDHEAFRTLMNRNFDLRATIFSVTTRDRQMVEIARAHAGAAKQCGSGGAVIGMPAPGQPSTALERAYRDAGFEFAEAQFQAVAE